MRIQGLIDKSAEKFSIAESRTLVGKSLNAAELDEAIKYIKKNPDYRSYHLLFLLLRLHVDSYKELSLDCRAMILCSALSCSTFLNDWGYLGQFGSFDGPSAKALIEIGSPALKTLIPILESGESAPLFGSEEATISQVRQYRRKDYAYRYIMIILDKDYEFYSDLKRRDQAIDTLKLELASRKKS